MTRPIRFGTDGVRGPAGAWPISAEGAETIGNGLAQWTKGGEVYIGQDTRESCPKLVEALARGLVDGGSTATKLGVVPTAAVSMAVKQDGVAAGVMITASHNPWSDNGIKVVDSSGSKLIDTDPLVTMFGQQLLKPGGRVQIHPSPLEAWKNALPKPDLTGQKILLDGAHGAGSHAAAMVLRELGARVIEVAGEPNGRNINDGVGAMHPNTDLNGCDLGICLDGDADRLVMVHPTHGVLDGDDLLWMLAKQIDGPVVGTVMSNGGLEEALSGRLVRTGVGDAKVHAEMKRLSAPIGGEPSGHIMIDGGMPTSDGLYTALRILEAAQGAPLEPGGWTRWPQAHRNVRNVTLNTSLMAIDEAKNDGHRVLVRASGTEPLVRVMVEGARSEFWAQAIADALVAQTG